MSSNEGALLVLPEGAERHDVRDRRPFFEQASRHAATWYHFAEGNLGRIISHDSIYVITGFHKARSWGLAGYQNDQGNGDFSAQFTIGAREGAAGYSWETTRSMDWRVGPFDGLGIPNQSVFIRGFKIALRSTVQGVPQRWVSYHPSPPSVRPNHGRDSWLSNVWKGISKTIGASSEGANRSAGPDPRENLGVRIEIQRIPEILPVGGLITWVRDVVVLKVLLGFPPLGRHQPIYTPEGTSCRIGIRATVKVTHLSTGTICKGGDYARW